MNPRNKPKIYYLNSYNQYKDKEYNFCDFLFKQDMLQNYEALIDVGGYILNKSVLELTGDFTPDI
jgi:hypothetical protein